MAEFPAFRIGFGYDIHPLAEGEILHLGGVAIPSKLRAVGHSDADVLIHAICDALLGAARLRDIGVHFPNTDPQYKGIDSKRLLERVMELVRSKGYLLGNIDATVCLEAPKINPYVEEMCTVLAACMNTDPDNISIKATTNEMLGSIGRGEGICAFATALLYKNV